MRLKILLALTVCIRAGDYLPVGLPHCEYDLLGNHLSGSNSMTRAFHWNFSDSYYEDIKDDPVELPVSLATAKESITQCLGRLWFEDKAKACVAACLYQECSWGEGFHPEVSSCKSKKDGAKIFCASEERVESCQKKGYL